jgi:ATP-dependent Lon protease
MITRLQSKKRKVSVSEGSNKDRLLDVVDQIYSGEFFEIPEMKIIGKNEDIRRVYNSLEEVRTFIIESIPTVIDIAEGNYSLRDKCLMLENIHILSVSDIGSIEYNKAASFLNSVKKNGFCNKKKFTLNTSESNMKIIDRMYAGSRGSDTEGEKYKTWIDSISSVPFGIYIESVIDINRAREILDTDLAFLEGPKDRIINILAKLKRRPNSSLSSILIHGAVGTGKTSIAKSIAKSLGRPFSVLPLAGESDASILTGHHFTYTGAICSRIISILSETKCMNPVILIDELDKVSKTEHGKEIIGALIHITDTTSNASYTHDRYFSGIEFDLSKILFIFTANDIENINTVLLDRLFEIPVKKYNKKQEMHICKTHIIPNLLVEFGIRDDELNIDDETIEKILQVSKRDSGLREVKRTIELIISRINTLIECEHNVRLDYKQLARYYNQFGKKVLKEHVDMLLYDYIKVPEVLSMYM